MHQLPLSRWFAAASLLPLLALARPASACGGFFCSAAQPVNQAAERIIFAKNADHTVTAVIEIQYQGPSSNFSWLLPIATAPDELKLASSLAFQRLQAFTNPQYTLTTRVEGECDEPSGGLLGFGGSAQADGISRSFSPTGIETVSVAASGSVGPFDWAVISVAAGANDPAAEAVAWLEAAGYDVPPSAPGLLGPYLSDGMFLLALKLTKGADVGSIRPIALTYAGEEPMIPMKLTSVAANDDMGVMAWLLGDGRGVPQNYLSLELNEARLNWFNPTSNYNALVIDAANDAGGQGFVTEYADEASTLERVVWSASEEQLWQTFSASTFSNFVDMYAQASNNWSAYEGFLDAIEHGVTLSASVSREDFRACPACYTDQVDFSPAKLLLSIESNVIEPLRGVQDLLDAAPKVTRVYTTLSANEMTVDPVFTFNRDLPDVSNLHTAERVIECTSSVYIEDASFRIELPQGDIVRGVPNDFNTQTWPAALAELPPNRLIFQRSSSGQGKLGEDNAERITTALDAYNATVPRSEAGCGCGILQPTRPSLSWLWFALGGVVVFRRSAARSGR